MFRVQNTDILEHKLHLLEHGFEVLLLQQSSEGLGAQGKSEGLEGLDNLAFVVDVLFRGFDFHRNKY